MAGFFEPTPLPQFDQNAQMSMSPYLPNISVGNPQIDMLISMLLGGSGKVAPRPVGGQSVQDAFQSRDRSLEFLKAMRQSLSGSLISQKMGGLDPDSQVTQILAMASGGPNGLMNNPIMKAFNGGNPMQAQMGLLKNFTGMSYQALTGRLGNLDAAQSNDLMQGFTESMFNTHKYTQEDIDKDRSSADTDMLAAMTDPKSKGRFNQFIQGDGKIDHAKLAEVMDGADEQARNLQKQLQDAVGDQYKKVFDSYSSVKDIDKLKGHVVADSVNFKATRGFESQDLTKSFAMATDLGLFDSDKYRTQAMNDVLGRGGSQREAEQAGMKTTGGQYIKNATRVLRATADLTGDTTAEGAMTSLNQLLGRSMHDLGDEGDARRIEDLLRKVKASARIAGVSIDAMKGIIGSIRGVTEQQSDLQYNSDTTAIEMGTRAMTNTYSLQASMGTKYMRSQGGSNAVLQQQGQLIASNQTDIPAQEYEGIVGVISGRTDLSKKQRSALYKKVSDIYMGPNAPKDQASRTRMLEEIASGPDGLGTNAQYLMRQIRDPMARQAGALQLQREMDGGNFHGLAKADEVTENVSGELGRDQLRRFALNNNLSEVNMKDGRGPRQLSADERTDAVYHELANRKRTGKQISEIMTKYGLEGSQYSMRLMTDQKFAANQTNYALKHDVVLNRDGSRKLDDKGQPVLNDWETAQRTYNTFRDQSAKNEGETAENLAQLQAPIATYAAQFLIGGDAKGGIDKLMEGLGAGATRDRMGKLLQSTKQMMDEPTSNNTHAAIAELFGGPGSDAEAKKNLLNQGHSEADVEDLMRRRHQAMNPDNLAQFDKIQTSGLSVQDILSSSKAENYGDSAAGKMGIAEKDVFGASQVMKAMHMDDPEMLKKYGTQTMDSTFFQKYFRTRGMLPEYNKALEQSYIRPLQEKDQKGLDTLIKNENADGSKKGDAELAAWKTLGDNLKGPDGKPLDLVKDGHLDLEKAASIDFSTSGDADESTTDQTKLAEARKINAQRDAVRKTGSFVNVENFKTHADQIKGSVAEIGKQIEGKDDAGTLLKELTDALGSNGSQITRALNILTTELGRLGGT